MDYLADWREIAKTAEGSQLKRNLLLRKIDKFERDLRRVGGRIDSQAEFVKVLCTEKPEEYEEMMSRFCFVRLKRNDYSDWSGWEYRNTWATDTYHPSIKRWRLEPVQSLCVLGEQGIGDEIMFGSCLPEVLIRVPRVVVECDKRLHSVFERSFRVECRERRDLTAFRPEDVVIPIGDLPRLFRKRVSDFPRKAFLRPENVEKWSHLKGRTGIVWRSRTGQYKPEEFGVENPVCLQLDHWEHESQGMTVPECDLKDDIEDLMGICANLERVVTVPQTICHIAGSIGAKVDVIMPKVGSSRVENTIPYRYGDPMLWYQNVKVYQTLNEYLHRRPRP